jgi:hypothetical protein
MKDIEQKVYKACEDANWVKLQEVLSIVKDKNQKQQIKKMFSAHMQEITDFILNSNFLKT